MSARHLEGGLLDQLAALAAASVDSVVTRVPHANSSAPGIHGLLRLWLDGGEDPYLPGPTVWREVHRVLKPGGHVLCRSRVRDQDLLGIVLRMAGFEIRDCIRHEHAHDQQSAWEPVVVARKALEGTVAQNILQHGCGGLNIDACRVEHVTVDGGSLATNPHLRSHINGGNGGNIIAHEEHRRVVIPNASGRFPANVVHDGSPEVMAAFAAFGEKSSGAPGIKRKGNDGACYGTESRKPGTQMPGYGDSGSIARFFFCARSCGTDQDASEQDALAAYLCTLVTPPGGTVLDPFAASGTVGHAAEAGGFAALLIGPYSA